MSACHSVVKVAVQTASQQLIHGAIAQLGERLHGMQEVGGSIPPGSTKLHIMLSMIKRISGNLIG